MTQYIESYIPAVMENGLRTQKAASFESTLSVTGALTAGAITTSGLLTIGGGVVDNMEVVTATNVITAAESGKTFFLSAVAGFESTLPTAALGLNFRFVVATAPTSNGYTITGSPADKIFGTVACSGAEDTVNGVTGNATDNVILVHNVALIGDLLEFFSDGTNWYVTGNVNTFAAVTMNG